MRMEKEIEKLMKNLKISREEAIELIEEDKETDRMTMAEINAEMTPEERKVIKSMTACSKGQQKKKTEKVRKVDNEKKYLFDIIAKALDSEVTEQTLKNEVELSFVYNANHYTLKLTKHRPPK